MTILVTGAAGFIGSHVCHALLDRGQRVVGIDNLNDYYPVTLKRARLARLETRADFSFVLGDIADRETVAGTIDHHPEIEGIIHLAAQAGVRHSLVDPYIYIHSNVMGQVVMLEQARRCPKLRHFVYASSSSVYGGNRKLPFSIDDPVEQPVSLYAATKKSCELIGHTYAHLYGIPSTGLRFFTVYGPWGRPDMAAYLFADAILAGRPITVFGQGAMKRDFTFIDDIVAGVLATLDRPPVPQQVAPQQPAPQQADSGDFSPSVAHRVFNLGNHQAERLMDFIGTIETALGRKAEMVLAPIPPGDVPATWADIEASQRLLEWQPTTPISVGIPRFIAWYKDYHGISGARFPDQPEIRTTAAGLIKS